MKRPCLSFFGITCIILLGWPFALPAADMRIAEQNARLKKTALLEQLQSEKKNAQEEAQETSHRIQSDRKSLLKTIEQLKTNNRRIQKAIQEKQTELKRLEQENQKLLKRQQEIDTVSKELVGFIRVNAKDLDTLINRSLQSAFFTDRGLFLRRLLSSENTPDMSDVSRMVDLLMQEIRLSGEVRIQEQALVDRSGQTVSTPVLVLGNFTTAFRSADETGFALYSEKSRLLFALSRLPSGRIRSQIESYMTGQSDSVPIDISRGSALRQISSELDFFEQIKAGGPVVWPILAIFIFGILIISERLFYLLRRRINAEKLSDQVNRMALARQWETCGELLETHRNRPLAIVLMTALKNRKLKREDIENALQETILGQIPPLERFLSTLGIIASIAPLLGLLGTVTGMINTFHTITYFGTGDAKMMSGGISEALVTTMLGLSVAIPIMFAHTLISRFVENLIAQMEEKAVAFVNTIEKIKEEHGSAA